jgi:hypothetical protein
MRRAVFLAYLHALDALTHALDAISGWLDRAAERRSDVD